MSILHLFYFFYRNLRPLFFLFHCDLIFSLVSYEHSRIGHSDGMTFSDEIC